MITYKDNLIDVTPVMLEGFFVGWPNPPSRLKHLEILQNSDHVILAVETNANKVIGFINAITDKVLSAYIPLLEVLPEYHGKGIGEELVTGMLSKLKDFYMIDVCCRKSHNAFYEKFGMKKYNFMIIRNFSKQSGR
jgi:ribosomal protein S18 acetylase RimI-like enzyme